MNLTPSRSFVTAATLSTLLFAITASAAEPARELHIGKLPANKVLFLGNSITLHGPAPAIGWTGNWGMAASAADKDYVHLLTQRLARSVSGQPKVMVKNIADFERQYDTYDPAAALKPELAFDADLIIIAVGENVPALKDDAAKAKFAAAFARLLTELKKDARHPAIFVRSTFWPDPAKDAALRAESATAGATFVDISAIGEDPANAAKSERKIDHPGVAAHPGDQGMAAIADAIGTAIEKSAGLKPEPQDRR